MTTHDDSGRSLAAPLTDDEARFVEMVAALADGALDVDALSDDDVEFLEARGGVEAIASLATLKQIEADRHGTWGQKTDGRHAEPAGRITPAAAARFPRMPLALAAMLLLAVVVVASLWLQRSAPASLAGWSTTGTALALTSMSKGEPSRWHFLDRMLVASEQSQLVLVEGEQYGVIDGDAVAAFALRDGDMPWAVIVAAFRPPASRQPPFETLEAAMDADELRLVYLRADGWSGAAQWTPSAPGAWRLVAPSGQVFATAAAGQPSTRDHDAVSEFLRSPLGQHLRRLALDLAERESGVWHFPPLDD